MNPTEKALLRAETLGGRAGLNCIAELDPTAPGQAGALEKGGDAGPLSGVPILVKDNIDVMGLHTTAGSLALADNLASVDAPVVANLRRRGAVLLGKTNMTEFANYTGHNMPGGYSSRGGQVLHAVDPRLDPSGSSTGSAVAVAAGIVPMAVGTDTSFSIIACAKFNGVCGLKPPVGALPGEGIVPIAPTLESAGPLARTFSDALRLYSVMRDEPLPTLAPTPPRALRVAFNRANADRLPPDEGAFLQTLAASLRKRGATVSEVVQGPAAELKTIMQWEFRPALEAYLRGAAASRKTLREIVEYYESHPDTMLRYGDAYLRAALDETPGGLRGAPYLAALGERRAAIARVSEELGDLDAVVMTGPTNIMHFCGLPSATVAGGGKTAEGVDRAVILYGRDEYRLYAAALTIEQLLRQPNG